MDKLNNAAEIIEFQRTCKEGGVVLAKWYGQFVTWNVSNAGDCTSGNYFEGIAAATADFVERTKVSA